MRLSALDAAAENAVRVIGFFDQLIAQRAAPATLAQETARLAECPVGVGAVRAEPGGRALRAGGPPAGAAVRELPDGRQVWLERTPPALPLDEILLERLAIAAAVLLDHGAATASGPDEPALVELALSAPAAEAERSHALRQLGFVPQAPLLVLAVVPGAGDPALVAGALGGAAGGVRSAPIGRLHAVLAPGASALAAAALAPEALIGAGPVLAAVEAPAAWRRARTAARFAGALRGPVVHWADLGALAVLADRLGPGDLADVGDLAALDRLAGEPGGAGTLALLAAYCETGSVRKAAAAVYRHHSTAAARVHHAEQRLGFPVTTPRGRLRLELALLLHHLRDTPD